MAKKRYTVTLFSIIRTAIINGLDPYRYFEYALESVSFRIRKTWKSDESPAVSGRPDSDPQARNGFFQAGVLFKRRLR